MPEIAPKYTRPSKPLEITSTKVLLVEGQDEVNFFEELHKHLGLDVIQIINVEGKDNFPDKFSIFLKHPNFKQVKAYTIIHDADTSQIATFASIKALLENNGQPCPKKWSAFASTAFLKVGVFIMPGNAEQGMLETLCLQTVADHPVMPCVDSYISCLGQKLERKMAEEPKDRGKAYYPKNEHKAKVQAFLSAMHETTASLGLAAKKGYWPFDHNALAELRSFLKKLAE